MNFLIIGSGGREHALARALHSSRRVSKIYAIPGSDGIGEFAQCQNISTTDHQAIAHFCSQSKVTCVVIGPEVPLSEGLSDFLREQDLAVFGPSRKAAELESSKIFSKEFMLKAKIPTAKSWVVRSVQETLSAAYHTHAPYVLKADGLAAGKGVYICKTLQSLEKAASDLFDRKVLGSAGEQALLEEFSPGYELSFLAITNGENFESFPLAQDHKTLLDADEGPNTGGMGTTAPMNIDATLSAQIRREVFEPTMKELKKQNLFYRGVLFVGLMITKDGPSVLEFNTRFGDPETQVILPLLDGDWAEVFFEVSQGVVPKLKWKDNTYATCVVLSAENYPENPKKNVLINGIESGSASEAQYLLHAGTRKLGDTWVTNGGRVLNAVGIASSREESRNLAYDLANKIHSVGMHFRKDIGIRSKKE